MVKTSEPYKLVGRTFKPADTVVDVAGVAVGGPEVIVMAGPCSVETEEQGASLANSSSWLSLPSPLNTAIDLRQQGTPIPTNDLWIAALVLQHNLTLCDRDRHFDNLPQLNRI